jgi:radical SAM superfamily enzyme YgiQ (UPF0313 family)
VGYESGNQQILNNIKKGIRLDVARRFTRDCKALAIAIHGTFILGLPGESRETIEETIRFACDIDPDTIIPFLVAPARHDSTPLEILRPRQAANSSGPLGERTTRPPAVRT